MMHDRQIVDGLKSGDSSAFRELYLSCGHALFTYLQRVTGRREMAEELMQETFMSAIKKIGFFRAEREGALRSWVFRIATHLTIDALRREKHMEVLESKDLEIEVEQAREIAVGFSAGTIRSPQDEMESQQFEALLNDALKKLPEAQRMIFILKEQEGLSAMEVSRICGCSENAVKQSLFRARVSLRNSLCGN